MQPSKSAFIFARASPGAIQGLLGPASASRSEQTNVSVLDAGDVRGMRAMQGAAGKGVGIQRMQLAGREHAIAQFLEFAVRPSHQ